LSSEFRPRREDPPRWEELPAREDSPRREEPPGRDDPPGREDPPGFELPLRLLLGFRSLIDAVHEELGRQGHPDMRPMHGFVFQAIGPQGITAADLGRRLGISKQAAGKTIDSLESLGYVRRERDSHDQRQKAVFLTERGFDALARSARIFDHLRADWADRIGADRLRALEADLRTITGDVRVPLDVPGWFGAG
jgi:DNA-binding MarR family transcriptional regulator